MNLPRDRDHDLQRLLSEDGGEFGVLYRRLSQVDPPRRLDRAVLGEAARAVRGRAPRGPRWIVGLGSAAGLVLAAGIAWQVGHDALRESSLGPARDDAPMVVPVAPITERAHPSTRTSEEARESSASQPAATVAAPPPPAAATKPRAAAKPAAPPAALAPTPAPRRQAPAPAPPTAFPVEAEPLQQEHHAPVTTTSADTAGAAQADAADTLHKEQAPRARNSAPPAPSSSIELRHDLRLAPAAWIAHVRDLLAQGRRQQAIESLQLYQRTHSDRPVPSDLRPLLD